MMTPRPLGYIDHESAVQLKGRVACEVTTCDELIATELVFANALTDMAPEEIVALLSGLVFQEKIDIDMTRLTKTLNDGITTITDTAKRVAEEQLDVGMDTPTDEYVRTALHWGLVEVVYAWASNAPDVNLCYTRLFSHRDRAREDADADALPAGSARAEWHTLRQPPLCSAQAAHPSLRHPPLCSARAAHPSLRHPPLCSPRAARPSLRHPPEAPCLC